MNRLPQIAFDRGYRAHPDGSVTNPKGKRLKLSLNRSKGYRMISFALNLPPLKVSRLVAYQKFGEQIFQTGIQVRHLDGNRTNDAFENIAIGTQWQNSMDVPLESRRKNAEKAIAANRKHDAAKVASFYQKTGDYKLTMEIFRIKSCSTVYRVLKQAGILARRPWKSTVARMASREVAA